MRDRAWPWLQLAALCGVLFFWRLGAIPLIGLDEGLYSECSREMLATGNYLVPTCNGAPFYDKPPVVYWLQAASMHAFGVNSFAARLPSAIAQLLLVGLTVFLGVRLFSQRVGLMAGFVLTCSILTIGLARLAVLDAAFALAIAASLGAFLLAHLGLAPRWTYLVFWGGMGLSVMIKGPAGAVLICGTIFVYLLVQRNLRAAGKTMPIAGTALFLAVAAPWYIAVQQQTGGEFMREFLIHHNVQRALGQDFQHNMPLYYYMLAYLVGFFPWSAFVPAALRVRRDDKTPEDIEYSARLFLVVWIGVMLVAFSLVRSKLPSYIYPVYAPSALLVGRLWADAAENGKLQALRRGALAASPIALMLGAAMVIVSSRLNDPITGLSAAVIPMGAAVAIGSVVAYALLYLRRPMGAFAVLCAAMSVFAVLAVRLGLPIAARANAIPAMEISRAAACHNEPTFAFRLSPPQPQLGCYTGKPVPRIDSASELPRDQRILVIAQDDRLHQLPKGGRIVAAIEPYLLYRFEPTTTE